MAYPKADKVLITPAPKPETHIANPVEQNPDGLTAGTVGAVVSVASVGAAVGAAIGMVAGIPGMVAGGAVGGAIGALAGEVAVVEIEPTSEEKYWRDNHENRSYFDSTISYDAYAPAYRFGIEAFDTYVGRSFDAIEPQLAKQWDGARGSSRLTWATAKLATPDAYERLGNREDSNPT